MAIHPNPSPASSSSSSHTFSLPASHFAKLEPHAFLRAHLPHTRPSQRSPNTARPPTQHTNSLTHTHGSAVVRLGATAAVCGVRGEILDANHDRTTTTGVSSEAASGRDADAIAELGLLVPNVELATGCHPSFLPGAPPSGMAQGLTQRVLTLLHTVDLVRLEDLQIWAGENPLAGATTVDNIDSGGGGCGTVDVEMRSRSPSTAFSRDHDELSPMERKPHAYWTLYIDILFLSLDGAAFDAAWACTLAALRAAQLPSAWWDAEQEGVLCDPRPSQLRPLSIRGFPVALSFAVIAGAGKVVGSNEKEGGEQSFILVDPDDFEEGCCEEGATVVVDEGGSKVWRMEKNGGDVLSPEMMRGLVERAGERWEEWKEVSKG